MAEFLLVGFVLICVMIGYWVFALMPKQRDFVKRQEMARALAEGDEVITGGGLIGRVREIDSQQGIAYVELADGLVVRMVIAALIDRYQPDEIARYAKMGQKSTAAET